MHISRWTGCEATLEVQLKLLNMPALCQHASNASEGIMQLASKNHFPYLR